MSQKLDRTRIAELAQIVPDQATLAAIPHPPRTFELPSMLYGLTATAYLGFIGILGTAFSTRELILPLAIITVLFVAAFVVPAMWARTQPDSADNPLSWGQFRNRGVMTNTGRMTAGDATVQVLVLPTLILLWAVAVAVIAALT